MDPLAGQDYLECACPRHREHLGLPSFPSLEFFSRESRESREYCFLFLEMLSTALSQSGEISPDFCSFYGGGIRHNEDIYVFLSKFYCSANSQPPSTYRNKDMEINSESAGCRCYCAHNFRCISARE